MIKKIKILAKPLRAGHIDLSKFEIGCRESETEAGFTTVDFKDQLIVQITD